MSEYVGRTLDKYRLVRLIGEGGMGGVYEAEHVFLSRKAAVKVMHPRYVGDEEAFQRFMREAHSASAIGHPNIVEVIDVGRSEDDVAYIVMELLRGEPLDELLERKGRLHADRAISIMLQVLSALNAAHIKGIIHRDLKPANVFMHVDKRDREEVKLLDFGVAKVLGGDEVDAEQPGPMVIRGTPYYVSPEEARGSSDIDHRIDLWKAGVMLFELLTEHLPFPQDSYEDVLAAVLLEPHPQLQELWPEAPAALGEVVDTALAKEPGDRYSSASEMMQALVRVKGKALSSVSAAAVRTKSDELPARDPDLVDTLDASAGVEPRDAKRPAAGIEPKAPGAVDGAGEPGSSKNVVLVLALIGILAALAAAFYFFAIRE